jgi:ParB family chromosome partitioning protein
MTLRRIPISLLDSSEFESRLTVTPLATVGTLGVVVPVLVRPKEGGRFEIIAGHRRVESVRKQGLKTIVCSVKRVDDKKAALLHFGENVDRADLSATEKGNFFQRYMEKFGATEREAERELGVSHSLISQCVGLAKIAGEVVKRLTTEEAASIGEVLTAVKYQAVGGLTQPQRVSVLEEAVKHHLSDRDTKRLADHVQAGTDVKTAVAAIKGAREGKKIVRFEASEEKPARTVCRKCLAHIWVEHLPNGKHKILESSPGKPSLT